MIPGITSSPLACLIHLNLTPRATIWLKEIYSRGGGKGGREPRRIGGRRGTGDGRRKGGKQERNSKILHCLSSSQRNKPNNVSWLPFNLLQGLKQKFRCEKSQHENLYSQQQQKKQHYFGWSWKPLIQAAYITGHEWDSMTHVQVCRLCQLCQCLLSVSPAVKILRKNDKVSLRSNVKCHQRPFWSISVFFGVVGKNPSMEDLPTSSFHTTVDHKTLKILLRGVNLCWRDATNQWSHWRAWSGSIYNPFFIFGQGQSRTPY